MDKKQKILIGFSTVYAVLLILLSLGLLYNIFIFQPNKYAIEGPINIVIEDMGNGEYKVENQIFKCVKVPNTNSDFLFGYPYIEFMAAVNSYKPQNDNFPKNNIYMVEKQIYIIDDVTKKAYLLFFIDSNYFYVNIDIFKGKIACISKEELYDCTSIFLDELDELEYYDYIPSGDVSQFLWNFMELDYSILGLILPNIMVYKPIIYLYPTEKTDIQVNLDTIDFTTTYPQYDNGWFVTAYSDGTLIDKNGREYNYLYWEGLSNNFVDLSRGFVVEKNNYIEFLETTLSDIGMVDTEINDFISYWLPQMNEYEYCFMSFQMENYEKEVELKYSVEPNNELRVFVAFCGLNEPINVEPQDLSYYDEFVREGFVVVEWGGTFLENTDAVLYQTHNSIYKNGFYNNPDIKNLDWCSYFSIIPKDISVNFPILLNELIVSLNEKLDGQFYLEGNKIYLNKEFNEGTLLLIIEEYGIYLDLDVFKELNIEYQEDFLRVFSDWMTLSNFDYEVINDVLQDLADMDSVILNIINPFVNIPLPDYKISPKSYFVEHILIFVIFVISFPIPCLLGYIISRYVVTREITTKRNIFRQPNNVQDIKKKLQKSGILFIISNILWFINMFIMELGILDELDFFKPLWYYDVDIGVIFLVCIVIMLFVSFTYLMINYNRLDVLFGTLIPPDNKVNFYLFKIRVVLIIYFVVLGIIMGYMSNVLYLLKYILN